MRISDWSSDVCSSDLVAGQRIAESREQPRRQARLDVTGLRIEQVLPVAGARTQHCRSRRLPECAGVAVDEIGRASCRARVCQYVSISVVAVALKKKTDTKNTTITNSDRLRERK